MARLPEKDRNAILLHFFENQPLPDVGTALGLTPDSARMRVARALEKLKGFLTRRGVVLSVGTLGTLLSANAVQAAPIGFAASLAPMALIGGTTASLALAKATLSTMTWLKVKRAVYVGGAFLLAAGGTALLVGLVLLPPLIPLRLATGMRAVPSSYQVSGTIREERFFGEHRIVLTSFTCRVEGQAWRIETIVTSKHTPKLVSHGEINFLSKSPDLQIACSDGRNFYVVTEARFPPGTTEHGASSETRGTFATIGAGNIPIGLDNPLLLIWYAFASADYLKARTSERIVPLKSVRFEDVEASNYLAAGRWQFLSGVPGLPKTIQTSNYFDLSITGPKDLQKLTFPHTNVDFRVVAWTNSLGLTIPTMMAADYFFYRIKEGMVRGFHDKRLDLVVTSISRPTGQYACPPPLPAQSRVSDTRFWFSNPPAYVEVVSKKGWPKDAQLAAEYRWRTSPHSLQRQAERQIEPE
jgi:hypothetical protein